VKANSDRQTAEQLKHSYPDAKEKHPEVVIRVNDLVESYNKSMKSSETEFRNAEAEFASAYFRFPDAVTNLIRTVMESLGEMSKLTCSGLSDQADLQFAKFRDDYKKVTNEARGWRLSDPIEWIRVRGMCQRS
jgi:hypothetical protein